MFGCGCNKRGGSKGSSKKCNCKYCLQTRRKYIQMGGDGSWISYFLGTQPPTQPPTQTPVIASTQPPTQTQPPVIASTQGPTVGGRHRTRKNRKGRVKKSRKHMKSKKYIR